MESEDRKKARAELRKANMRPRPSEVAVYASVSDVWISFRGVVVLSGSGEQTVEFALAALTVRKFLECSSPKWRGGSPGDLKWRRLPLPVMPPRPAGARPRR